MSDVNKPCPHSKVELIHKNETYVVKREPITIEAQVAICQECGEELFIPKYDDNNLKKAYDIYRKKHNLLSDAKIVDLRQKYQLSQRAFAVLLGCTQATINRYENGAIPDPAYNSLILLMEKAENVKIMLEQRRNELEVKDAQKLEVLLERMLNEDNRIRDIFGALSILQFNKPNMYSGFKKFDINKVVAMITFFAAHQKELYKTKLMKLLWYADMLYFKRYVQSISGMRYAHLPYGPVPEEHDLLLGVLKASKYIDVVAEDNQCNWEKIVAMTDFDCNCLNEDEKNVLNEVNDYFVNVSAKEISDISHLEDAYKETTRNEFISYEYANDLKLDFLKDFKEP